jgi:threonine dehydratase
MASELKPTLDEIEEASRRIEGIAWRTPLLPANRHEADILVKLECLQRNGSFKIRGAWNRMSRTTVEERKRGFVTVSAGNHGQAVAWCAKHLGSKCTVWVPEDAVERKVKAMEAMGATIKRMPEVEIMNSMTDDRWERTQQTYIHPFGDRYVIAGQGTIGLEIIHDFPDVKTVIVPIGGGGLISGIGTAIKAMKPEVKVYGVQAESAAPILPSFKSGKPERIKTGKTFADGIATDRVFDYMWPIMQDVMDEPLVVGEDEMRDAVRHLANEVHVVAEGGGAAALAAAWKYASRLETPIICIVSGGNIDNALFGSIISKTY